MLDLILFIINAGSALVLGIFYFQERRRNEALREHVKVLQDRLDNVVLKALEERVSNLHNRVWDLEMLRDAEAGHLDALFADMDAEAAAQAKDQQ